MMAANLAHVLVAIPFEGIDDLSAALAGGTTALVGQSGAGKSTLVNVLAGRALQAVNETRQDGRGGTPRPPVS